MNFRKLTMISAGVVVLMLSGCSDKPANTPGVGAGTSANVGVDTSSSESISRERQISVENSSSSKISMPAWALLVEAAKEMNDELLPPLVDESGTMLMPKDCPYGLGKVVDQPVNLDDLRDELVFSTNCGKAWQVVMGIIGMSEPILGWPSDIMRPVYDCQWKHSTIYESGIPATDKECMEALKKRNEWITVMAASAERVNLAASEIIKGVQANALRDPDDAKLKLKVALADFVKAGGFDVAKKEFGEGICRDATLNFSGSQEHKVEFSCGGAIYGGDSQGWSITKNGIDWFGNGVIMGKKIDLALDSAISTGMSKRSGISSDQGTGAAVDARGEAGIK
jgi:hypothetical protein